MKDPAWKEILHDVTNALICGILMGVIMLCLFGPKAAVVAFTAGAVGYYAGWGEAKGRG